MLNIIKHTRFCFLLIFCFNVSVLSAKELHVYHDADYSINSVSAHAMKMGFLTALDEVGNDFSGYQLRFMEKNHRGNLKRSFRHMQQFLKSDKALFVLGGLHSPPYIKNREFINKSKIPLLVPWAAGGPITRYPSKENWVFRLSIDDTKAGIRLGQYAKQSLGCDAPHLLLESTPWGKSNFNTVTNYFGANTSLGVTWFDWNTKSNVAKIKLREAIESNAKCLIFVGNYAETSAFFDAMAEFPEHERIPFVSHWGFTGGDLNALMTERVKGAVELSFLQSCYNFSTDQSNRGKDVLARAKSLFPEAEFSDEHIEAPAGFIHAYDLGKVVFSALKKLKFSGDIKLDRRALRNALESKDLYAQGLIKDYTMPFSPWAKDNTDAHEALGLEDFCMAKLDAENHIIVKPNI